MTEVAPGLVETEFSRVRFDGDEERAAAVYRGMTPLTAADVADAIAWAASRPSHVNVDRIVLRPSDQATCHASAQPSPPSVSPPSAWPPAWPLAAPTRRAPRVSTAATAHAATGSTAAATLFRSPPCSSAGRRRDRVVRDRHNGN